MLYVLCTTDNLFPAAFGVSRTYWFQNRGVEVTYRGVDTPAKHQGPLVDWEKWLDTLANFLVPRAGV